MFTLRPYQEEAINKILWAQKLPGNDLLCLATASGKSLVLSEIANRLSTKTLILQPSKEILEQNVDKMLHYVGESEIGIYSASMQRKDVAKYTFATIGSVYKKPELFQDIGLVIIDEADLAPVKDGNSMYSKFLKALGDVKVIGLTATPYRNEIGYHKIKGTNLLEAKTTLKLINRVYNGFWRRLLYVVNPIDLIDQGYLSPVVYEHRDFFEHKDLKLNKSESEFDLGDFEIKLGDRQKQIVSDLIEDQKRFNSMLVFCPSVAYAEKMATIVPNSAVISANTPKREREEILAMMRSGNLNTIFNVATMTTGVDIPHLEAIVLIRPVRSLRLYCQMAGRVLRKAEGKEYGTIIDYSGTVKSVGRVESIRLMKDEEGKWNVATDSGFWHNRKLYSWTQEVR